MPNASGDAGVQLLLSALKLDYSQKRKASFSISTRSPLPGWVLYSFDTESLPVYALEAMDSGLTQVYSFASTVNKEAFILICNLGERVALVTKKPGKDNPFARRVLLHHDDFEKTAGVLRKIDLSNSLMAHASLSSAVSLLREGAERDFVNLGVFSNYFLRERMVKHLSQRGRSVANESTEFIKKVGGEIPAGFEGSMKILDALGYEVRSSVRNAEEYRPIPKNNSKT